MYQHRATVACHLAWNSVGLAKLFPQLLLPTGTMESLADNDPLDSSGYIFGGLNTVTNMTIVVPNSEKSLEPGWLASKLLPWHDL